jgi:hypothetical protein
MHHACVAFDRLYRHFIVCLLLRPLSLESTNLNLPKTLGKPAMSISTLIFYRLKTHVDKFKCDSSPASRCSKNLIFLKLVLQLISVLYVLNEVLAEVR